MGRRVSRVSHWTQPSSSVGQAKLTHRLGFGGAGQGLSPGAKEVQSFCLTSVWQSWETQEMEQWGVHEPQILGAFPGVKAAPPAPLTSYAGEHNAHGACRGYPWLWSLSVLEATAWPGRVRPFLLRLGFLLEHWGHWLREPLGLPSSVRVCVCVYLSV